MSKPLENVKVLDLTRVLAGPYCTMLLSDLGAEIIKVEVPEKGDDARHFGPFKKNKSLYFLSLNRGKESISLDLKTEKGKEILRELVKQIDILVENYRPGTMEKLGLGYEELKQINPKLIYAASSGFGHTYAGLPTLTVPAGLSKHLLPFGLQGSTAFMQDEQLIAWGRGLFEVFTR